jgi:hypothetical protein
LRTKKVRVGTKKVRLRTEKEGPESLRFRGHPVGLARVGVGADSTISGMLEGRAMRAAKIADKQSRS